MPAFVQRQFLLKPFNTARVEAHYAFLAPQRCYLAHLLVKTRFSLVIISSFAFPQESRIAGNALITNFEKSISLLQ
jgi:hypothetical protein